MHLTIMAQEQMLTFANHATPNASYLGGLG